MASGLSDTAAFSGDGKPPAAPLSKRGYVTFLAGSGDYVKGVVGLAKGLRKVKSAYPLVVAALPDVPEEHRRLLREQGCDVREVEPIRLPENQVQFAMAYYVINYSKMRVFEGSKPWRYTGKEDNMDREDIKMLVAKWWEIYNDESLDFKPAAEEAAAQDGKGGVVSRSPIAPAAAMEAAGAAVVPAAC